MCNLKSIEEKEFRCPKCGTKLYVRVLNDMGMKLFFFLHDKSNKEEDEGFARYEKPSELEKEFVTEEFLYNHLKQIVERDLIPTTGCNYATTINR